MIRTASAQALAVFFRDALGVEYSFSPFALYRWRALAGEETGCESPALRKLRGET